MGTPVKTREGLNYRIAGPVQLKVADNVNYCPHCMLTQNLNPSRISFQYPAREYNSLAHGFFQCTNDRCQKGFVVEYRYDTSQQYYSICTLFPYPEATTKWPELIQELSSDFVTIYNQANKAENLNLNHAAGPTYRKSLEFLIKDFILKDNEENRELISKLPLAKCIKEHIESNNVKLTADRAAWLGNDETHYIKKWDTHDINDLKRLIKLTVNHIESEILTKQYEKDMPR